MYRNLANVTAADLDTVKRNFAWVKDQLDHLKPNIHHKVVIFMGSPADQEHCQKIAKGKSASILCSKKKLSNIETII